MFCNAYIFNIGASAGQADARRRDAVDAAAHRQGAATQQMPARRRALKGCWLAGFLASLLASLHTAVGMRLARASPLSLRASSNTKDISVTGH